eukprot:1203164-Ditylum_brightwellii.AAC.1
MSERVESSYYLQYHLMHSCHDNCTNIANHRALGTTEYRSFLAWRNRWFPSPPVTTLQQHQQAGPLQPQQHYPPPLLTQPIYRPHL